MALKILTLTRLTTFFNKLRGTYCGYATCTTAASTTAKTAAITGFKLVTGARVSIRFSNTNTASNPTLNISSTGAKAMYFQGARITSTPPTLRANTIYDFIYTGTNYELVGSIASGYGF